MSDLNTLTTVRSRDGHQAGTITSTSRPCQLESCGGIRVGVRWPDGSRTFPCSKGMRFLDATTAQIG